jgi:hypothetical protein
MRRGIGIRHYVLGTYPESRKVLAPFYPYHDGLIIEIELYVHIEGVPLFTLGKRLRYYDSYGTQRLPKGAIARIDPKLLTAKKKWYTSVLGYSILLIIALVIWQQSLAGSFAESMMERDRINQEQRLEQPRIGDIYRFGGNGAFFDAEVHAFDRKDVWFTVYLLPLPSETVVSRNEDLPVRERTHLQDSLAARWPKEPFLQSLLYEEVLDSTARHGNIRVPRTVLKKAFCDPGRFDDKECRRVNIDGFAEKAPFQVYIYRIYRRAAK